MTRVIIVIREAGSLKPDYSLEFDVPEVPKPGSYISIHRPDKPQPYSEDLIVEKVWWRLEHPETAVFVSGDAPPKIGSVKSRSGQPQGGWPKRRDPPQTGPRTTPGKAMHSALVDKTAAFALSYGRVAPDGCAEGVADRVA